LKKAETLNIHYPQIGYKTCNGDAHSFNPWNERALRSFGVGPGAINPESIRFHVSGDLYEVPGIARRGHECGGSINVEGADISTGRKIELSHIFYRDEKGHRKEPPHWNHELWIRIGDWPFKLFNKRQTIHHIIPKSDWIELFCVDLNGNRESKKVYWEG